MTDDPLARTCNGCGSLPSKPCLDSHGRSLTRFHMHRITGDRLSVEAANNNRTRARERHRARKIQGASK